MYRILTKEPGLVVVGMLFILNIRKFDCDAKLAVNLLKNCLVAYVPYAILRT